MEKTEHKVKIGSFDTIQTYLKCPVCNDWYNVVEYFLELNSKCTRYVCPQGHSTVEEINK